MDFFISTIERLMKSKIFNIIMVFFAIVFISYEIYDLKLSSQYKQSDNYKNIKVIHKDILDDSVNNIKTKDYIIKKGDNILSILLLDMSIIRDDYIDIVTALKKIYNPNKLNIGQIIKVKFSNNSNGEVIIHELEIDPYKNQSFIIKRESDGNYMAKKNIEILEKNIVRYSGKINPKKGDNGIFDSMIRIGIPAEIVDQFITMYSFDIDFGRDIYNGTKFEVIFERYYNQYNIPVEIGNILYSAIRLGERGRSYAFYTYKIKNKIEYFDVKGNSVRKSLLKTPINGARISSRFGLRRHPILGYSKMHKGIDFAARKGTPIFAAGAGIVNYSGWKGAYGRYIKIKHNSQYQTAYAHLSKISSKVKKGRRVKQGDIIGYVGSTGRSTGPHLHYEVLRAGKQVNPSKMKSTPGIKLSRNNLEKFKKTSVDKVDTIRLNLPNLNESL